jgi:hypothetical protein
MNLGDRMKFMLGGLGNWFNDFELVKNAILEADKLGYDGALMPDHYMWGDLGGHGPMSRPDANVTMETQWLRPYHSDPQVLSLRCSQHLMSCLMVG